MSKNNEYQKKAATSMIETWAGNLARANTKKEIKEFVKHNYHHNSFFKPTLAPFVKNEKNIVEYFIGFRPDLLRMENLNVIQAESIGEKENTKLIAKGTYNFVFEDKVNAGYEIVVRADFSFIFDHIKRSSNDTFFGKIYLQHSSLQVKDRVKV